MADTSNTVTLRNYEVIAAGHICLDIIPHFPETGQNNLAELFRPGKLINVEQAAISTGGPVSNTGLALKRSGLKVAFMSKVGDDDFGELILRRLKREGSAEGIKIAAGETSSYTVALAPPGIDRIFLHNPGTNNTFGSNDVNFDLVRQAKIFHLGYPPLMKTLYQADGAEMVKLFQLAKAADVTTSLDMSLPDLHSPSGQVNWRKILEQTLPYVDIFLPSIEEAFFMVFREEYLQLKARLNGLEILDQLEPAIYSRIGTELLNFGAKIIALKSGHRGFYLRTRLNAELLPLGPASPADLQNWAQRELWCPSFRVPKIASATGSGDSAIAGFYAAYLRGYSIEKTLKYANCLGFQNLHALDAVSGIRSWEETQNLVEHAQLPLNPLPISAPGWHWDTEQQLWHGPHDYK
ncbi:carbohydrate kinase family protein [candidate division KSB1 bacterium]|nr:carbohydrate kinase family protein [candidate division KSB1 bacterium]